jgi:lysophospholipid acyltransferase (LPLAT)-like uncharacterized protein
MISLFCRLYARTLRVDRMTLEGARTPLRDFRFGPVIFAHSERIDLAISPALLLAPFVILLDHGRDGNRAAHFLRAVGCTLVRGSSRSSGERALRRLVETLETHPGPAAICVDGPYGPPGEVKPGIILCAARTGRVIIPLGAASTRRYVFRSSWSGIFLPLPGSTIVIVFGEPLSVAPGAARDEIERRAQDLASRMRLAQERADEAISWARARSRIADPRAAATSEPRSRV